MSSLGRVFTYVFRYWPAVLLSVVLMIINVVAAFYVIRLTPVLIDEALPTLDMDLLFETGGLMIGIAFVGLITGIINTITSQRVAMYATADLRMDLFEKIERLSFTNIDKFKTSRLITTSTNDVMRIQQFFQMLLRIIIRAPLMFGIGLYMAIVTSRELSNIFYISLPLLLITIVIIMVIAFPRYMRVQKTIDGLNKVSLETANAPRVIKSFVRMDTENQRFDDANQLFKNTNVAAEKVNLFAEPIIMLIFNSTIAGLIFLGAYYMNQGLLINDLTGLPNIGVLMAFNNYTMFILFGLLMFAMIMIFISRALASANRIKEVLDEVIDLENDEDCIRDVDLQGEIEFKNVDFAYEKDGNHVLNNISFHIKTGERIGIIGSTGSGKSSLIQLIPRLYDVVNGQILIDGVNIKQYDLATLRSQIGFVTQTATIFSGSIGTNMQMGKSHASFDELVDASTQAQAMEFIEQYDDWFNHETQQKGSNLSGGQKQRVSLARAFVRQPKILILDDSTSAVDAKSEEAILQQIDALSHAMTSIVISQKISTIKDMDKILVLSNKGEIDGFASHEELMKTSTVYQEIALSQLGGGAPYEQ
ncbi:ABC transporter ATP-binding protein [Candidatus Xianfuyuplasma coldseepsis]|uniref:ABC transporter ATP-binding protein n=1 Tax=Candidatus Xianfuyuplasma coldseepsis TaxID=2782163 RepID=A0A7L7KT95_9MOLU|nr:ABC transporter ATP-binding protein [Xianfuyuplasma coldseepsis]QMS85963.1 ABC transporter ATP-binding protein [Xianfuyuplasma coldseepsis]